MPRFVIHEHHARSHHFDLRLERDGALTSRVVPEGMPDDPNRNRLAQDHTPAGEGGAAKVPIWDSGSYEPHERRGDEVIATFHGGRVAGRYAIFRAGGKNRFAHRMERP